MRRFPPASSARPAGDCNGILFNHESLRLGETFVNEVAKVAAITGDNAPALQVGQVVVLINPRYFRPTEVETLLGDPSKAKKDLGWVPEITLDEMVQEMVAHDLSTRVRHQMTQVIDSYRARFKLATTKGSTGCLGSVF